MGVEVVFENNFQDVIQKMHGTSYQRMEEAVNEVRNHTLLKLTGKRTGRTYFVPGTKKTYTASAPGEPPAQVTAELRQSVKTAIEFNSGRLIGAVGTDKKKGPMLEFGTRKMAPRPWLRKSFEESNGKLREIFTRVWF